VVFYEVLYNFLFAVYGERSASAVVVPDFGVSYAGSF